MFVCSPFFDLFSERIGMCKMHKKTNLFYAIFLAFSIVLLLIFLSESCIMITCGEMWGSFPFCGQPFLYFSYFK